MQFIRFTLLVCLTLTISPIKCLPSSAQPAQIPPVPTGVTACLGSTGASISKGIKKVVNPILSCFGYTKVTTATSGSVVTPVLPPPVQVIAPSVPASAVVPSIPAPAVVPSIPAPAVVPSIPAPAVVPSIPAPAVVPSIPAPAVVPSIPAPAVVPPIPTTAVVPSVSIDTTASSVNNSGLNVTIVNDVSVLI